MNPSRLDHVAYWVEDRHALVPTLEAVGMHVIGETDRFTLVGADARRGKLTLFDAEGPRQRGAIEHVAFRVPDLSAALAGLDDDVAVDHERRGAAYFNVGEGLRLGLVESERGAYDIEHVTLRSRDPAGAATFYGKLGFAEAAPGDQGPRVSVADAYLELWPGEPEAERPLLNHLALLVSSAEEEIASAKELGLEIESVVDAPNTYAVFVWGPERVRVEYVEHKTSFALA